MYIFTIFCLLHFCCGMPAASQVLACFDGAFALLCFGCISILDLGRFDVVAYAVAAWMNVSVASNFLKQLSEPQPSHTTAAAKHTPDKYIWRYILACFVDYIYVSEFLMYKANVPYIHKCVCYILKLRRSFIYVHIYVASLGMAIHITDTTLCWQHMLPRLLRQQCCCACIQKSYGISTRVRARESKI